MTTEELRNFVATNDSFGFEMRVCAALNRPGVLDMQHGATYSDPVTGIPRQFDFRFRRQDDRRCIHIALECKNVDPAVPVIVCGRKRPKRESFHQVIVSSTQGSGPRSLSERVQAGPHYAQDGFVGKSVLKPSRDGNGKIKPQSNDSDIHDRWAQAIASSHELIVSAARAGDQTLSVVLPMVVLPDKSLYKVMYDEIGNPRSHPEMTDHCTFYIGHRVTIEPEKRHSLVTLSHIHFLTLSGLEKFLRSLEPRQIDWEEWIPPELVEKTTNG